MKRLAALAKYREDGTEAFAKYLLTVFISYRHLARRGLLFSSVSFP